MSDPAVKARCMERAVNSPGVALESFALNPYLPPDSDDATHRSGRSSSLSHVPTDHVLPEHDRRRLPLPRRYHGLSPATDSILSQTPVSTGSIQPRASIEIAAEKKPAPYRSYPSSSELTVPEPRARKGSLIELPSAKKSATLSPVLGRKISEATVRQSFPTYTKARDQSKASSVHNIFRRAVTSDIGGHQDTQRRTRGDTVNDGSSRASQVDQINAIIHEDLRDRFKAMLPQAYVTSGNRVMIETDRETLIAIMAQISIAKRAETSEHAPSNSCRTVSSVRSKSQDHRKLRKNSDPGYGAHARLSVSSEYFIRIAVRVDDLGPLQGMIQRQKNLAAAAAAARTSASLVYDFLYGVKLIFQMQRGSERDGGLSRGRAVILKQHLLLSDSADQQVMAPLLMPHLPMPLPHVADKVQKLCRLHNRLQLHSKTPRIHSLEI